MKTSNTTAHKMKLAMALTILVSSLLFMASCTKEETSQPSASQTFTSNQKQINAGQASQAMVFKSIVIDHYAAGTGTAQYRVTVFSNGSAIYEGIKDVKTLGTLKLDVSIETTRELNDLSIQFMNNSRLIKQDLSHIDQRMMAIPMVTTTYQANNDSPARLFRDYNNGKPIWLVMFRNEVERVLDIAKYTKGTIGIPDDNEAK